MAFVRRDKIACRPFPLIAVIAAIAANGRAGASHPRAQSAAAVFMIELTARPVVRGLARAQAEPSMSGDVRGSGRNPDLAPWRLAHKIKRSFVIRKPESVEQSR